MVDDQLPIIHCLFVYVFEGWFWFFLLYYTFSLDHLVRAHGVMEKDNKISDIPIVHLAQILGWEW